MHTGRYEGGASTRKHGGGRDGGGVKALLGAASFAGREEESARLSRCRPDMAHHLSPWLGMCYMYSSFARGPAQPPPLSSGQNRIYAQHGFNTFIALLSYYRYNTMGYCFLPSGYCSSRPSTPPRPLIITPPLTSQTEQLDAVREPSATHDATTESHVSLDHIRPTGWRCEPLVRPRTVVSHSSDRLTSSCP